MKFPRSRTARVTLALFVIGFLSFGYLVWLEIQPEEYYESDVDRVASFLSYKLQDAPEAVPDTDAQQMQVIALTTDVESFREAAVMLSDPQAVAALPQVMPGAFDAFLKGEVSAKFPLIWPYVIAGSFTVTGEALGEEPVVAFYNPYFDAVILSKWKFTEGQDGSIGFKMTQAVPITGQAFLNNRASLATDQPAWSESNAGIFETRLVGTSQEFVKVFEERYDPFGLGSADLSKEAASEAVALSVLEDRVFFLMQWVIDAQNASAPVNYSEGIENLIGALGASSDGRLQKLLPADNPQTAQSLFEIERDARSGMRPYLVVENNVLFINPSVPTAFLSVYFKPEDNGRALQALAFFSLAGSYPTN
jgi:hypothetical protein